METQLTIIVKVESTSDEAARDSICEFVQTIYRSMRSGACSCKIERASKDHHTGEDVLTEGSATVVQTPGEMSPRSESN